MPEINPLTNNQIFLKKIAENTGSDYDTGDVSEINPLTIDQIFLKEIAANTAEQSGDIVELEGKVADNTSAIEATQDMISDAYDSTHTYNVGDYCIHENSLYKCNTASTTGTWDSSKWDAVTVAEELEELTEGVIDLGNNTPQIASGTILVNLPQSSAYGFYYFFFPSGAFKVGKTVTIAGANFIGDSTEMKSYISAESYAPTDVGRIYKIEANETVASLKNSPLLISYSVG